MKTEHSSRQESVLNKRSFVRYLIRMCISENTRHVYAAHGPSLTTLGLTVVCDVVAGMSDWSTIKQKITNTAVVVALHQSLKMYFKLHHLAVFGP